MFDPLVEVGAERNFATSRTRAPGTAARRGSRGRSVADCVADVAAVADALGYERFYSVGSSGGAPHSIACAALLPDRVISAAAIASPAPLDAEGLDWTAGMGKENVAELAAAQAAATASSRHYLEREADSMLGTSADEIVARLGDLVSEVDRRALTGALGEFIVRETRAFAVGRRVGVVRRRPGDLRRLGIRVSAIRPPALPVARRRGPIRPDRPRRVAGRACHAAPTRHLRPDDDGTSRCSLELLRRDPRLSALDPRLRAS